MIINGPKQAILWVCTGFHCYVFYYDDTKIKLTDDLRLKKVIPSPFQFPSVTVTFRMLGLGMIGDFVLSTPKNNS